MSWHKEGGEIFYCFSNKKEKQQQMSKDLWNTEVSVYLKVM